MHPKNHCEPVVRECFCRIADKPHLEKFETSFGPSSITSLVGDTFVFRSQ